MAEAARVLRYRECGAEGLLSPHPKMPLSTSAHPLAGDKGASNIAFSPFSPVRSSLSMTPRSSSPAQALCQVPALISWRFFPRLSGAPQSIFRPAFPHQLPPPISCAHISSSNHPPFPLFSSLAFLKPVSIPSASPPLVSLPSGPFHTQTPTPYYFSNTDQILAVHLLKNLVIPSFLSLQPRPFAVCAGLCAPMVSTAARPIVQLGGEPVTVTYMLWL